MEQREPGAGVGGVDVVIQAAARQQSFKSTQSEPESQRGADGDLDLDPEATGSRRYEHVVCILLNLLSHVFISRKVQYHFNLRCKKTNIESRSQVSFMDLI